MIVEFAEWTMGNPDYDSWLAWITEIVSQCRAEDGCLAYELRVDPHDRSHGSIFQAWENQEAFNGHLVFPAHQRMIDEGKQWRMSDVRIHRWSDAGGYDLMTH